MCVHTQKCIFIYVYVHIYKPLLVSGNTFFFNEEVKANWSQGMHKKVKHQLTFINRICGC